jgi:hypothetical protein
MRGKADSMRLEIVISEKFRACLHKGLARYRIISLSVGDVLGKDDGEPTKRAVSA